MKSANRETILFNFSCLCISKRDRVWDVFCHEQSLVATAVWLDCAFDGRRFCRASVASHDDVVFCDLYAGARLPGLLS